MERKHFVGLLFFSVVGFVTIRECVPSPSEISSKVLESTDLIINGPPKPKIKFDQTQAVQKP